MKKHFLLFILSLSLLACNGDTRDAGRSGTYQDDNLEAPILDKFKQYEPALVTSNKVLDLLKQKQYGKIVEEHVDDFMRPLLNIESIGTIMNTAEEKYGKIVSYKPMQWGFEPKTDHGKRDKSEINKKIAEKYGDKKAGKKVPIIFSVKIVKHEKATLNYWFQFPSDGKYDKLMGIFYKEKKGTRHIGQL